MNKKIAIIIGAGPAGLTAAYYLALEGIQVDNETDATNRTGIYEYWLKDFTATYSEDCQSFLGVEDEILADGLNLYPNPVSNILTID